MKEYKSILKNIKDVNVSSNELITRMSLNRNFKKLFENDLLLEDLYNSIIQSVDIQEYHSGETYNYGQLVWFKNRDTRTEFYLLKSIVNNNVNDPKFALYDLLYGLPDFEKYGWKNENQKLDLKEIGIDTYILQCIDPNILKHESDTILHKFGIINVKDNNSSDYIDKKILKKDLSNIAINRNTLFFPYQTGHFITDNITNGEYRIWDNGILELNIVFRLGYVGKKLEKYNLDIIECNNVKIKKSTTSNKLDVNYNENAKYFNSAEDMTIFNYDGDETGIRIGNTIQTNRNDFVNVYSADLDFSAAKMHIGERQILGFKDTDYMIFTSDTLSQDRNFQNHSLNPGSNTMTFCNKSRNGITALYISIPEDGNYDNAGYNTKNGGLIVNTFNCHIIGRYK